MATFEQILELDFLPNQSSDVKLSVLKLINLVQDLLSQESRFLLCKLGENQANNILSLFEDGKS